MIGVQPIPADTRTNGSAESSSVNSPMGTETRSCCPSKTLS
ncbi:Uncharacterised protein [Mycobacteroides abscessus subsp. abscessus]|nr:Uncharacterised protein [Mycobacteroides abscessus subsp. abscessus]